MFKNMKNNSKRQVVENNMLGDCLDLFQHMIKYRYLPFSTGKKTYMGKEDSGPVVPPS